MHESSVKVNFTEEYGIFRFLKGNRDLNETKVKRIIKSVESGLNFFKYCPIMVNEDHYIIDGQHRFYVCKKLRLPIFFVVVPEFSLRQVAEINNNQSRWKARDYMNCYIDADINKEHYEYLSKFLSNHKINISTAINMLMYGKVGGGGTSDAFRDGKFEVRTEPFATKLTAFAQSFSCFTNQFNARPFLQALEVLLKSEKYSHDAMVEKLGKHDLKIEKCTSYKEYLKQMEELFNYRNQKRQIIY